MKKEPTHFRFKGIKISDIDAAGLEQLINLKLSLQTSGYFCLTDVGNIMMAQKDPDLANAINQATASIADGAPLAWFGQLIGRKKIQRVSGVDLFQRMVHSSLYHHFLLGDTVDMQRKVIAKARSINPNIRISAYSPPFRQEFTEADTLLILKKIREKKPDIIWVSFGGGKQEKWMNRNASLLDCGIMIGVGAAFKYYTGDLTIPPGFLQRMGLQWMTRLSKNPKRWMTKGPLMFRILFSLSFPFELVRAKSMKQP